MADALTAGAILVVTALFLLANYGERKENARALALALSTAVAALACLLGLVYALFAAGSAANPRVTPADLRTAVAIGLAVGVAGAVALSLRLPAGRAVVERLIPVNASSPVDYTAMMLALLFLGLQLATQLTVNVLKAEVSAPPVNLASLLSQDLPFVLLAYIGVGLFTRRSAGEASRRLGIFPPKSSGWWLAGMFGILVFLGVGVVIEDIARVVSPSTASQVSQSSSHVFAGFNTVPAVFLLSLIAGVAEELLFRGAMVPRFGVVFTSLLFAAAHTQYGITFADLEVFVLGLGLGWLRLQAGVLPCILLHVGYDTVVGIIGLGAH
jgi:membrane protease YdiL (CAAX protease family)